MAFTLTQLRTQVRDKAGLDANDTAASDTVLTSLINSAIRTMAVEKPWDWHKATETISATANTTSYARHATCRKSDRLIDTTESGTQSILKLVTPTAIERTLAEPAGVPREWTVEAGSLVIAPAPSTARTYRHVFWKAETALSGDSDTSLVPDWAVDLVVIRAALAVAARLDNTSLTRQLQAEEKLIKSSLEDDASRTRPAIGFDRRRDWGL